MGVFSFSIKSRKTLASILGIKIARENKKFHQRIPSDEIGVQPDDNKEDEKMTVTGVEKQPSSGRKSGCAGVGNVAPSKVTEKYKRNKYHEVNYCYGEGESL